MIIEKIDNFITPLNIYKNTPEFISFFLDSSLTDKKIGRFSVIGFDPFLTFRSKGEKIEISKNKKKEFYIDNPFNILKKLFKEYKTQTNNFLLPLAAGGAVGYFAYDLGKFIEKVPSKTIDDINLPDCFLGFYDFVLIFDNIKKEFYIVSADYDGKNTKDKIKFIKSRIKEIKSKTITPSKVINNPISKIESNYTKDKYIKDILRIKEYIKSGDVYQVNLSQRFSTELEAVEPFELYKTIRKINPAPFSAFLNFSEFQILSSSPERFLQIKDGIVETRPIKGTRPRGKNIHQDKKNAEELVESIKDKAEHLMIVDLERNDLGRVCDYNTIKVKELYKLEKYATVFHLVSTITGRLYKGKDVVDMLKACFPGGSITGAPKIRAMEIIDELEPTKRCIYTGSIGYIDFNGNADLNIVIRTLILKNKKVYFQLGGGIVIDSDPEKEYQETLDKGKAFFDILGNKNIEIKKV